MVGRVEVKGLVVGVVMLGLLVIVIGGIDVVEGVYLGGIGVMQVGDVLAPQR